MVDDAVVVAVHAEGVDVQAGKKKVKNRLPTAQTLEVLFRFDFSVLEILPDGDKLLKESPLFLDGFVLLFLLLV